MTATSRIWPSYTPPDADLLFQSGLYTIGTEFELSADQQVVAVWLYSGSGETSVPVTIAIYEVSGQSPVAEAATPQWSGPAASGWISETSLAGTPLAANTRYKACITPGSGTGLNYWEVYFETGQPGGSDITSGTVTCFTRTSSTNGQCSYAVGAMAYPAIDAGANNYWIDIEVEYPPPPAPGNAETAQELAGRSALSQSLADTASTAQELSGGTVLALEQAGGAVISSQLSGSAALEQEVIPE